MKLIYLKSALKCDSFDVAIDIKIQFFRVLVTIEPGRSLLQFVTTNSLIDPTANHSFRKESQKKKLARGETNFQKSRTRHARRRKRVSMAGECAKQSMECATHG